MFLTTVQPICFSSDFVYHDELHFQLMMNIFLVLFFFFFLCTKEQIRALQFQLFPSLLCTKGTKDMEFYKFPARVLLYGFMLRNKRNQFVIYVWCPNPVSGVTYNVCFKLI